MHKKLKSSMLLSGRSIDTSCHKTTITEPFFNKSDWTSWLNFVSDFYKQKMNQISEALPLFINKESDNRPYLSVRLFDRAICVLFDSGANASIVGAEGIKILKHLKIKINPVINKNIFTADGSSQKISGVADLPIFIDNSCEIIKVLVVPSVTHSFIFGSDFARQFNLLVDFQENSWCIRKDKTVISTLSENNFSFSFLKLFSLEELPPEQKGEALKIIDSFKEIDSKDRLGRTNKIKLTIDTGDSKPFKMKPYLLSPYLQEILNKELDSMLKLGVIENSESPWSSPTLLVKKANGEYRFCFDGRALNKISKHDSYPLPHIDRILNNLRNAKFISSIDLRKAFWQIPLDADSREKTAFL